MPVAVPMDVAPYRLSGRVYGALLNHRAALAALGDSVNQPPYKAPPRAPVLYIKPQNTLAGDHAQVTVPPDVSELEVGACLGVVIGRTACRLSEHSALEVIAGYVIVNDISIPHPAYYRPSVRFKARDGFCPVGPRVVGRTLVADPDALRIQVSVDGTVCLTTSTAELVRPVARLLADVSEFMTLSPGDILATGAAAPAPRVCARQRVSITIEPIGTLETYFAGNGGEPA